jgi:NADPH-dependent 2,4-dienoyl-CoA reductase/sulfur reductase-like enzyme
LKHIIIGGVAAGMSAASKIKRIQKDASIHVYAKGAFLSYGACGLCYFIAGMNDDYNKMIARTREEFEEQGIKTFLRSEAVGVHVRSKTVTIKNLDTGEIIRETYDKLMIATGAEAVRPPIDGIDKKGVYTLKTLEDGLCLKKEITRYGIKDVVIVGGGYIGIEMAEALHALGKRVVCLEAAERILLPFDVEIADLALAEIKRHGVEIKTGEKVLSFKGGGSVNAVVTENGEYIADAVVVATGVKPSTGFLADTGIAMEANGAVIVDRQMRTSVPDVYSAGDCAVVYDRMKKKNVYLPLGAVANKCGRIAGGNMCGGSEEFPGALSSAALKVFDLQLGRTGLGEKEAAENGFDFGTVFVEGRSHPIYYPGSEPLMIKLVYEKPSMKILGAQLCGKDGAALRTDIFAVAIHAGMTTKELGMIDLIYSPPYAGVWDAVHIACNAAKQPHQ